MLNFEYRSSAKVSYADLIPCFIIQNSTFGVPYSMPFTIWPAHIAPAILCRDQAHVPPAVGNADRVKTRGL